MSPGRRGDAAAFDIELAPIRVNVISPGRADTPIRDTIAGDGKAAAWEALVRRLPAGRIGTGDDLAQVLVALMRNRFVTGTVLQVDGGHPLV